MLVEAIRTYLVSLGVEEANTWTPEELLSYADKVLLAYNSTPEEAEQVVDEFMQGIKCNLTTIAKVITD